MIGKPQRSAVVCVLLLLLTAASAQARIGKDEEPEFQAIQDRLRAQPGPTAFGRVATPAAEPDIFGPGAVLNVGNVIMKVSNYGTIGQPFVGISSDPSGQWPGQSGVEYLNFILLSVGAVNPLATDPTAKRRVSYIPDWWPPTADPVDRMYRGYDGIINGSRLLDDDTDGRIDEDFLDGRDNDGDGRIDEDFGAYGQLMYTCLMRDDTPAAIAAVTNEQHVPLVLEAQQTAWAYSVPGFTDFNVVQWDVYNRSGHTLDSMYFGIRVDVDAGPASSSTYYSDDMDVPFYPQGEFLIPVDPSDPQAQVTTTDTLCQQRRIKIQGFSVVDNDGDEGRTGGIASLLLFGHTIDPLGLKAPRQVGFRAFRSFVAGTPYASNGHPSTDQQKFEFFSSLQNIDPQTGLITAEPGDQQGDYNAWVSVGPFLDVPDGGMINCTVGFAVAPGAYLDVLNYTRDYDLYKLREAGSDDPDYPKLEDLMDKYPALENAFSAQVAYEGVYEPPRSGLEEMVPGGGDSEGCYGCETCVRLPRNSSPIFMSEQCEGEEAISKQVTDNACTWFNFDCDLCTGVWDGTNGYYLRHWNAESPPPSPNLNVASTYNYTDNPDRVVAAGDRSITLAWDNISENTPDPKTVNFDFRTYRIWKVAGWRRPVGSSGPNDEDWALLAEYRLFDHADSNKFQNPDSTRAAGDPRGESNGYVCPQVFIPNLSVKDVLLQKSEFATVDLARTWLETNGYDGTRILDEPARWRAVQEAQLCKSDDLHVKDLASGVSAEICQVSNAVRRGVTVPICLYRGDFWDRQSGHVLRPQDVSCVPLLEGGGCVQDSGRALGVLEGPLDVKKTRYTVGRYLYVDREVQNGFLYFYSVTAGDSSSGGQLYGRRSAVEADQVTPQAATSAGKNVWVVPNPYRGFRNLAERSSAWDLTPNAADPTGTHIDFMGMPSGPWTIKIFTVSGDLVAELRHTDPINESIRGPVTGDDGTVRPGFNRQQDNPNDGQARWNLISRNGQDVVSGIYLFVVDSDQGQQRGKFVVIR